MGVGSLFRRLKLSSKTHSKSKDSITSLDIENQTGELSQSHRSSQFSDPPLPFPEPEQLGTIDYTTEEPHHNNPDHSTDLEDFIVGELELESTTITSTRNNTLTNLNNDDLDNDAHTTFDQLSAYDIPNNNPTTTTAIIDITLPNHTHQEYDPGSTPNQLQHSPSSIIQSLLTSDAPSLLVPGDDGNEQHHSHNHTTDSNNPHTSDEEENHRLDIGVVYLSAAAADIDEPSLEAGEGSYPGRPSSLSGGGGTGGVTGLMNVDDAVSVISSMTEDENVTAAQLGQALEALEEEAFSVTGDVDNTNGTGATGVGSCGGSGGGRFFSSLTSMVGGGAGSVGTSPSKDPQQQQQPRMSSGVAASVCSVGGEFFLPSQSASLVKLYNNLALKMMDSRRKEKRDYEQAKILLLKAEQLLDNDGAWAISVAARDNSDDNDDGGTGTGTGTADNNNNGSDNSNYKMVEDEIAERRNRLRAITYNNMGCLMKRHSQPAVALSYLSKALPLEETACNVHNACSTLLNICAAMSALKRYKEALSHAERAILLLQHELWGPPSGAVPAGSPTPSFQTGIVYMMRRLAAANIALNTANGGGGGGGTIATTAAAATTTTTTSSSSSSTPIVSLVQLLAMAYHNAAVEHERLGKLKEAGVSFARAATLADRFMGLKVAMTVSLHKALKGFHSRSGSALPPTGLMGGSSSMSSGALRKIGSKSSLAKSSSGGGSSLRARHTSPRRKGTTTSSGKLAVDKGRLSSGQRK